MSMWRVRGAGRGIAMLALTAGLSLSAVACSSGDGEGDGNKSSSSETAKSDGTSGQQGGGDQGDDQSPVAEIKGKGGILLTITEVKRDSGGFVTINGAMKNTGSEAFSDTPWAGSEEGVAGNSLAGAALIDKEGKKRYYTLRDTEKRCLCTSGIDIIDPGQVIPIYMQFPAPPDKVKEIEFQLPTFPPTTLPISE